MFVLLITDFLSLSYILSADRGQKLGLETNQRERERRGGGGGEKHTHSWEVKETVQTLSINNLRNTIPNNQVQNWGRWGRMSKR